jgi:RNA polymerase sigma-70 factor (ECF subfamily)
MAVMIKPRKGKSMLAFIFNQPAAKTQQHPAASTVRRANRGQRANSEIQDSALLQRIASRDQNAFAVLYDRYATVLYSLCLSILQRANDAEDVLQECFLQIWEKAHAFDGLKGSVHTWLVTMTRNRAIDRLRSKHFQICRQQQADFDFDMIASADSFSPLDQAAAAERTHHVRKAFATLPLAQREVLQMAYFDGYSQSEIAGHLRIPLGTVKTRTRQAIKKLHALLEKYV